MKCDVLQCAGSFSETCPVYPGLLFLSEMSFNMMTSAQASRLATHSEMLSLKHPFLFSGKLWASSLQSPEAKKNQGELKELLAENKNLSSSSTGGSHHARQSSKLSLYM